MQTNSLYNKYRPVSFGQIKGQELIIEILQNTIRQEKINHAYLLYGTRGVGKTSLARIFSKALNCLNLDKANIEPCNACESCNSINNGSSLDVIEIDAASNNGVDEIRLLKERAHYNLSSNYKIFIIDEVHMLSKAAFNALLKILEEPPENVIFMLLTTEISKIPETILSRTLILEFTPLNKKIIQKTLISILKQEGFDYEESALELITFLSKGSLRDAISILEKIILLSNEKIQTKKVLQIFNLISKEDLFEIIYQEDRQKFLELLYKNKDNIKHFTNYFVDYVVDLVTKNQISQKNYFVNVTSELLDVLFKTNDPYLIYPKFVSVVSLENYSNKTNPTTVQKLNKKYSDFNPNLENKQSEFSSTKFESKSSISSNIEKPLSTNIDWFEDDNSNIKKPKNKFFLDEPYEKIVNKNHILKLAYESMNDRSGKNHFQQLFETSFAYENQEIFKKYAKLFKKSHFEYLFDKVALISFVSEKDYEQFKKIAFESNLLKFTKELFEQEIILLAITQEKLNKIKLYLEKQIQKDNQDFLNEIQNIEFSIFFDEQKKTIDNHKQKIKKLFGSKLEIKLKENNE